MSDPERLSQGASFAAQLLRAGAAEQPGEAGVARTLAALGLSGAVLTTTAAVNAAAGSTLAASMSGGAALSTGAAGGGATSALSAAMIVKWIGIGVVGGMSLAGAATVVTSSAPPAASATANGQPKAKERAPEAATQRPATPLPAPLVADAPVAPTPSAELSVTTPHASVVAPPIASAASEAASEAELGPPLQAEVTFVDHGRALLRAGRTLEGLIALDGYEHEFSEARLLPEVLFLRLEAYERLGRTSEARRAAARLLSGFPKSPHAARARKLLGE